MTSRTSVLPQLWVSDIDRPFREEFDFVVTISPTATPTDDGLRHRRYDVPTSPAEAKVLIDLVVDALHPRWFAGYRLLIQSPGGHLADIIAGAFAIHLGATLDEAILLLRQTRPEALSDPQHSTLLRIWRDAHA